MVPEREESEQGVKTLFEEIMIENFLHLFKKKKSIMQVQRVPVKMYPKRTTSRNIIIKMAKIEDKGNLKNIKNRKDS